MRRSLHEMMLVGSGIFLVTLMVLPLRGHVLLPNILMVYLFLVFLVAFKMSRWAALFASLLSTLVCYYYFVPIHSSFAINDIQYLLVIFLMLLIVLVTSHLASGLRMQIVLSESRERHIRCLYDLASQLAGISKPEAIVEPCQRFIRVNFNINSILLLPSEDGRLFMAAQADGHIDFSIAQQIFDEDSKELTVDICQRSGQNLYAPLLGSTKNQGILVFVPDQEAWTVPKELDPLLRTGMTLMGLALERLGYAERERQAMLAVESERLRAALLASLSHDIRTPVAVLAGVAESMALSLPQAFSPVHGMLDGMQRQISRLLSDVDKLLDMARLHRDIVSLNKEWQVLEEMIGSALEASKGVLQGYSVEVTVGREIPLLEMDAMMMERVFRNLLENVARHTPVGTHVDIGARMMEQRVVIWVADNGPGFPFGQEEAIFSEFVHKKNVMGTSGFGLGLSIVRAVVVAHGGVIHAENQPSGGAKFVFTLPVGNPPVVGLE
ncbi:MAG: DUF4118 domain-containing protein [Magnetococcales bacterium]|nr:DUF4118 domain-containing protein [Magnetococcales bacterium]